MEAETTGFLPYLWPGLAMLAGVVTHILKKAMKLRQLNATFRLGDYLVGHPYQTALTFIAGAGAYLTLMATGSVDAAAPVVSNLAPAFFAGVAANSLGDIASGERGER